MGRAEAGTPKAISNALKSKGLQRLRWYCTACQKQMRDENGFKCHTQSEGHIRRMSLIAENPGKHIQDFSNQFLQDFVSLLRTAHGEKKVQFNKFYQEYIRDKNHVHMNATRWHTLSEFCKFLGRQSICRVEETEKGFFISYIDKNPESLRRSEANRKRELQEKSEGETHLRLLNEQIQRAKEAYTRQHEEEEKQPVSHELQRPENQGVHLQLSSTHPSTNEKPSLSSGSSSVAPNLKAPTIPSSKPLFSVPSKPRSKNVFATLNKFQKKTPESPENTPKKDNNSKRPRSAMEEIIMQETAREKRKHVST
ncbi:KIN-like protein [Schizosaccharomyces osmophilus]|uniref:KIN-like protein n=1 Tax=Schizosaccharomyces osmophilus TaxID=2545709 RepID=A0AAE9WD40_9SCHI|nr:KIN-like protein [Schizosaccharomyces osmophilus]WBW73980.1 KIN-like protein [Schizosaccharomyces osmophilus]